MKLSSGSCRRIVQRLMEEGYLNVSQAPRCPRGTSPLFGPGGQATRPHRGQFNLPKRVSTSAIKH